MREVPLWKIIQKMYCLGRFLDNGSTAILHRHRLFVHNRSGDTITRYEPLLFQHSGGSGCRLLCLLLLLLMLFRVLPQLKEGGGENLRLPTTSTTSVVSSTASGRSTGKFLLFFLGKKISNNIYATASMLTNTDTVPAVMS